MWRLAGTIAAMCTVAACSSSSPPLQPGGPSSTSSGSSSLPVRLALVATDAQNHKVLIGHIGDTLRVQLGSTYWRFNSPSGAQVRAAGKPTFAPDSNCIPGGGCGTVAQAYELVRAGTARISASRTSCGEARLCAPNERSYVVTVIVRG